MEEIENIFFSSQQLFNKISSYAFEHKIFSSYFKEIEFVTQTQIFLSIQPNGVNL